MGNGALVESSGEETEFSDWTFRVECHMSALIGGAAEAIQWAESHSGETNENEVKYAGIAELSNIGEELHTDVGRKVKREAMDVAKSAQRKRHSEEC